MSGYLCCLFVLVIVSLKTVQTKLLIQKVYNKNSGSKGTCADKSCNKITTLNITLANIIKYNPFLHITAVPKTEKSSYIDNICYTYFDIGFGKILAVQSVVDTYGSSKQFTFIEEDPAGKPGVVQGGDSSCSYQDHGADFSCEDNLIVYRCYKCGTCTDLDVPTTPGLVSLFTIGSSPRVGPQCEKELTYSLQKMAGSKDAQFLPLPYKKPTQCVLSINGLRAVGAYQANSSGLGFIEI